MCSAEYHFQWVVGIERDIDHCSCVKGELVCSLIVEEGKAMFVILSMADLQVDAWGYMVK